MNKKTKKTIKSFHKDEAGAEAIVYIIALLIAVVILLAIYTIVHNRVFPAVNDKINQIVGMELVS